MKRIIEPLELMNLTVQSKKGCLPLKIVNKNKVPVPIEYNLKIGSAQIKVQFCSQVLTLKGPQPFSRNSLAGTTQK